MCRADTLGNAINHFVMAANYWVSTQRRHWLFTREKLADIRDRLRESDKVAYSQFPLPDQRLLNIYFNQRRLSLLIAMEQGDD